MKSLRNSTHHREDAVRESEKNRIRFGKTSSTGIRLQYMGRKPVMVVLTILFLALSLFGKAPGPDTKAVFLQAATVEPGLNALAERAAPTGALVPVIIQFEENSLDSERESIMGAGIAPLSDSLMIYKQPVLISAILWGDIAPQDDAGVSEASLVCWDRKAGSTGILRAVSRAWTSAFLDPSSIAMSDESILVNSELGTYTGLKLAASESPYYTTL